MSQTDEIFRRKNVNALVGEIAELHRNLGGAFSKKSQKREELWPASRNAMVEALVAISGFFKKLEGFDAYANAFNEFSTALADLDRGTIHVIFTAKARKGGKGKPPESTDIMCARGRVAIAVAYMMQAKANKRSKRNIANEIAAEYRSLARLVKNHTVQAPNLSSSIVSWYDQFNKGRVKNQEARDLFRTFQHWLVISQRGKISSSVDLIHIAHKQLRLATEFIPMTIEEVLGSNNFIEPKKVSKQPRDGTPRRGVKSPY